MFNKEKYWFQQSKTQNGQKYLPTGVLGIVILVLLIIMITFGVLAVISPSYAKGFIPFLDQKSGLLLIFVVFLFLVFILKKKVKYE